MKNVILLRRRRVLWGTLMAACLLSGFILTTHSANLLWRSAAVRVAQGSHFNPAASPNPESRIPNPVYGSAAQPRLAEAYGKLPLSFEVNKGQTDSRVKFLSRGSGYSLFLTGNEAVLSLRKPGVRSQDSGFRRRKPGEPNLGAAHQGSADLAFRSAAFRGLLRSPEAELGTNSRTADPKTGSALQGLLGSPASFQFPVSNFQTPATNNEPRTTDALLRMKLVGANPNPKMVGMDELPGKSNYFIGNDPKKWRTNVPNYAKVKYANVYPGVDLVYYGNQGKLEYDFVVSPGADPNSIQLAINSDEQVGSGQKAVGRTAQPQDPEPESQSAIDNRKSSIRAPLHVNATGDLVVGTDYGEVIFHKPVIYQPATYNELRTTNGGGRDLVEGQYVLRGNNRIAFRLSDYDRRRPVVIDPVLAYSTFLGGSDADVGIGIAIGASGNTYVTGLTASVDFPTTAGALQSKLGGGGYDAFVTKLNAAGSALLYSTYLGGSGEDFDLGIAVDASGNAYVTGFTDFSDFPTTAGAFQTTFGGGTDAFVSKLNATGSTLLYSTYLGGSGIDGPSGIAVDAAGNAYVTGDTQSSNFPTTPGAFQTIYHVGNEDAFVSKLNATGSALVYSTYLGGNSLDEGHGIAVDASGHAYVTGVTGSSDFPTTPGAFQTSYGGHGNAFVSKLTPSGSALLYSTYLGGRENPALDYDAGSAITVDALGNAYVTGFTSSSDFPTTAGAFQTTYGGTGGLGNPNSGDAFISKLNATGSALLYSTYLGGSDFDDGLGIAVDASGNAYVTGGTGSSDFPTTPGALQSKFGGGGSDVFVTKLNTAGSALLYSTYLGGSGSEFGILLVSGGIAVDASGSIYVTGSTASSDFPTTPDPFQATFGGGYTDCFVAKISRADAPGIALAPGSLAFGPQPLGTTSAPQTATLLDAGSQPLSITSIEVSGDFAQTNTCGELPAGTTCTISVTFTPTATGTRKGVVTITDNAAGSPHKLLLIGGSAPVAKLAPGSVTFLVLRTVGTTSLAQTVKLTNVGNRQLNITGIALTGPDGGDFGAFNDCPATVAVGASCLIPVIFTPTAQGVRTASLSIRDNAPGSPQSVPLTGRGTFFEWSPRSMNMGDQPVGTSSAARTVTLTNAGSAPIAIFSIGIAGVNPEDFSQTNDCGTSLKAGASCTIEVTFTPMAVGDRLGRVAISDSAFGGTHWVGLLGKGT
jgi:hypothetical protein